jgi:steroid delta-isomerase-like uncharacterized protein
MEAATAAGLDPGFMAEWAPRYLDAWNVGDAEAIAAMCSEDVTWYDPAIPETAHGRDGVRTFVEQTFRAFPDFHVDEATAPLLSETEPLALAPYRFTGTMQGPWEPLGMAPTGARVEVRGIDEYRFRDGLLSGYVTYYDSLGMARQLGVLPAAGSGPDRLMSRLQPLQARFQRRRR